jgi:transposase-like protein
MPIDMTTGMLQPVSSIESIPPDRFVPPCCPHPRCLRFSTAQLPPFRYGPYGSFRRLVDGRRVPRYRCRTCLGTFSQQSFATSYYLKRPELTEPIAKGLCAGSALRQIARSQHCSPTTVMRRSARLGRLALLVQQRILGELPELSEPIVYDDFESFTAMQLLPFGLGTAVGARTWLTYGLSHAPHEAGGRLTPRARRRRERLRRAGQHAARGAYRRACRAQLDLLIGMLPPGRTLHLISDGHRGYRSAVLGHPQTGRIHHEMHPNPPRRRKGVLRSRTARVRDRAMFPVDLLHRLIRHTLSHHRRETIAFGRREEAQMERGYLMMVWRNLIKRHSERGTRAQQKSAPAMLAGVTDRRWDWGDVLAERLFPARMPSPPRWMDIYRRVMANRWTGGAPLKPHALKFAF